ncbi:dolichyl-phosphate-mannose--protein mannosyltransferase [Microbacterium halophytorum]|uniref:dolichyl-phosphate-mannose--protein mannosyltransferase n=1 Tax=Microbacterium halophytorum TaxID=2067568 RepID=UPI000CFB41A9|nr:phospholipid carrier-dependent glycosyltransferase [Microbacterium halophytorum]
MMRHRAWEWAAPALVTLAALVLRFAGLGHPHELVFDETYYVKDAWSLWNLGYEGTWPDDANAAFEAGDTGGFSAEGAFVVHPPLGKWLIALGMAALGPGDPAGWRLATAAIGTLMVPTLYLLARRFSGSVAVAAAAAGLLAVDGLGIAMSRVALLDGILAWFVLLAVLFLVLDRAGAARRIAAASGELVGPVMWRRPWVLAAGAALGAATAVKWSGLYALAGLGIWLVVVDAIDRRRAGIRTWLPAAIIRQGPASFALLVPIALAVHMASWTGWFATSGGYDRGASANPLAAWWEYQSSVYAFHVGLTSGHPYASPAWQWPPLLRPTAMWVGNPEDGWIAVIGSLPNPIAWWAGMAAIVALIAGLVRTRRIALAWPLVGIAVTWLPWLLYPSRTTFQFYTIAMLPFVCLALAMALQHLARRRELILLAEPTPGEIADARRYAVRQRRAWRTASIAILAAAALAAAFFLPLSTGIPEPDELWRAHMWLPGWI